MLPKVITDRGNSALQIEKTKDWHDCSLGCLSCNGARRTRYRVWIYGRPLPAEGTLRRPGHACEQCVIELTAAWDGALVREERTAA